VVQRKSELQPTSESTECCQTSTAVICQVDRRLLGQRLANQACYFEIDTLRIATLGSKDGHEMLKLETLNCRDRDVGLTSQDEIETRRWYVQDETKTRRCYFSRRDWVVKIHVILIAVVQLVLFFTFNTSWRVNVIIYHMLATSDSTHINIQLKCRPAKYVSKLNTMFMTL